MWIEDLRSVLVTVMEKSLLRQKGSIFQKQHGKAAVKRDAQRDVGAESAELPCIAFNLCLRNVRRDAVIPAYSGKT